jgi:hypothetical protein
MSQKVYDLLSGGVSQADIGRSIQQRAMSNQYYWSAAAYASGNDELALMDQDKPWMTGGEMRISPASWAQ